MRKLLMGFLVVFVFGVFSKCVMGFEHFNVTKLRFEYLYGVSAAPATDAHVVDLTLIQGAAAKGAEGLSEMLRHAESQNLIQGLRICRGAPAISHLLFADDTLIFCKAKRSEIQTVGAILDDYRRASGQLINFQKSSMFFSKNTGPELRSNLSAILSIPVRADLGKYLGLPAEIGKSKTSMFSYIKDRVLQRLAGWKEKILSQAGKEVLLMSVAMALPTYAMMCFKLPEGLCHQIESAMARFWWGQKNNERKIHWMKWSRLCKHKFKGGLGFRDLSAYNLALLAKQGWRIMESPDCLMARVLKSKYFRNVSFLEAELGNNPSWVWRSIWEGKKVLEAGTRWSIGNGESVRINEDPWIPMVGAFKPNQVVTNVGVGLVKNLIDPGTAKWKEDMVSDMFGTEQARCILSMPLSWTNKADSLVWHFTNSGHYSVKSGYMTALGLKDHGQSAEGSEGDIGGPGTEVETNRWRGIWHLHIPRKIQHFLWKCCHNILPTKEQLQRKKVSDNSSCPVCDGATESIVHLFCDCPLARRVWQLSPFQLDFDNIQVSSFSDLWEILLSRWSNGPNRDLSLASTAFVLWYIWKGRNGVVFESKLMSPDVVYKRASASFQEFLKANPLKAQTDLIIGDVNIGWQPPVEGSFKINVDGAWVKEANAGGVGCVVRDSSGEFIAGLMRKQPRCPSSTVAEALAIREGVMLGIQLGLGSVVIECDAQAIVNMLNGKIGTSQELGIIIHDIKALSNGFQFCYFSFARRSCNEVAHILASRGHLGLGFSHWTNSPPSWLLDPLLRDKARL